jgi:carbon catabolite-derepressing protein kinase
MNLQLYNVDSINYLVDFHHKGSYLASMEPGAGRFDKMDPSELIHYRGDSGVDHHHSKDNVHRDEDEVVSPYLFMDITCRLILELAGGSE